MKHILNPFILFLNLLLASICQVDAQSTIVTDVFTPADATESVGHHSYNQIKKPSGAVYSMKVINTYSGKAVGISKSVKGSIYTTQTNGILKGICIKWYTGTDQSKNKLELYSSTKPYDELKDNDNPIYNDSKKGQLLETFSYNKQETYYGSHLNLLRKYKMGDFCIFVLPQTISYKSPICTKYSAKIQ